MATRYMQVCSTLGIETLNISAQVSNLHEQLTEAFSHPLLYVMQC